MGLSSYQLKVKHKIKLNNHADASRHPVVFACVNLRFISPIYGSGREHVRGGKGVRLALSRIKPDNSRDDGVGRLPFFSLYLEKRVFINVKGMFIKEYENYFFNGGGLF